MQPKMRLMADLNLDFVEKTGFVFEVVDISIKYHAQTDVSFLRMVDRMQIHENLKSSTK